ncbi:aspartyl protease family protein [Sphingobacterium bambusae]|uniref:Aspartyl protease family protein n=1 Tax=Sphingobacterium bambusae TaxID=662858 RepID=A0ABW6BE51_9SPHI|nr:aspartyl protease family protein [Sphingobacterium bambusae]WPL47578.1 aspartyl protease family protein [Sphingobacterium bambusae]
MIIKINLLGGLLMFSATAFAQVAKAPAEVEQVVALLNAKDSQGLLGLMADSCRIGNLPEMDNTMVIPEILSKFSGISSYEMLGDQHQSQGNTLFSLLVTYEDGKSGKPTFLFNKDGKLVNLGIIKARLRGNPDEALAQSMAAAEKPDSMRVRFELQNGLIYIPSRLNGQDGYFMFDSGAPVLILRKKYVASTHINKDVSVDFTGMGGMMQDVQWSVNNTLAWGTIELNGLDAPVASMDDMELDNGAPIFGLMGYGVLKGYQLTFDYAKQELLMERVDDKGQLIGRGFDKGTAYGSAPMRMKRHIPIVDLSFDGKLYPMGIDCGANANVLKQDLAQDLVNFIDYEEEKVAIAGVGGVQADNHVAYLTDAKVGDVKLQDMYTVLTKQDIGAGKGDDALPIKGLLGTPFLNQYKTTLNFVKGEITFYP